MQDCMLNYMLKTLNAVHMLVVFTAFLFCRQERVDIYSSNSDLNKKKFVFLLENLHLCMWYLAKRKIKWIRKYASLSFFL